MVTLMRRSSGYRYVLACITAMLFIMQFPAHALTRWSSVRMVPDADMLAGGTFVLDAHTYIYSDIVDGTAIKPVGMLNFGVTEWLNVEAGYTGGFNLGLKARILGETKSWMPSLAIGARNFFSHTEAYYYGHAPDTLDNEIFLVLGKSVEAARLRFHIGMQSIPKNEKERFSPFAAIEKYFGAGLYVTAEVHRRAETFSPSLFVGWRVFKQRLEVSAGVSDITGMFMGEGVPPNSPFFSSSDAGFIRPGIWAGLRFNGGFKFGKSEGLTGVETRLASHSASIEALQTEVDSLKAMLRGSAKSIADVNRSLKELTDSSLSDDKRYDALAIDKLAALKNMYEAEPFEPDAVKKAMAELVINRDRILPALYGIALDPVRENKIRILAVTAIGEIGSPAASDAIIEVLGQSPNPEMTIECLIALGKMKETRAVYLIQQLSNDPNDDVAFTAAEVLQKIEKETGVVVAPIPVKNYPESIPEKKIAGAAEKVPVVKRPPPVAAQPPAAPSQPLKRPPPVAAAELDTGMRKIEQPRFSEATVAAQPSSEKSKETKASADSATVKSSEPPAAVQASQKKSDTPSGTATASVKENNASITVPDTAAAAAKPPPPAPAAAKTPAAAPAPVKKEEKTARKKIDTSKDTW